MTRLAQPYEAVVPAGDGSGDTGVVVGSAPTLRTRSVHGTGYFRGIEMFGAKQIVVGVQHPFAGQGLVSPAFPFYQPSTVAGDYIHTPVFTTRNDYSPVSHADWREKFSRTQPVPATKPATKLPGVNNRSRRGGGKSFTYPSPFVDTEWPTSSQWLANRVRGGA